MSGSLHTSKRLTHSACAAAVIALVVTAPAYAYTDPGSGAMMLQLLLASLAGAAFYFRRGLSWISRRLSGKQPAEEPTAPATDDAEHDS